MIPPYRPMQRRLEMNRLATFMHISDLHFGTLNLSSLNAANAWWMRFPILDGFLGHSERALVRLDQRFAELKKTEQAQLIITGDLTTIANFNYSTITQVLTHR